MTVTTREGVHLSGFLFLAVDAQAFAANFF